MTEIYSKHVCTNLRKGNLVFVNGIDKYSESDRIIIAKTTRSDPLGHGGF